MAKWMNPSRSLAQKELQPQIPREAIAKRAYEKFLERGGTHGDDWRDWFEAEEELKARARRFSS